MSHLSVKNWSHFQQYKDRDPKWIKLHRDILNDYEFDQLTEVQQCHLMKVWLLASKLDNKIPNDSTWIGRQIGAKSKVDIKQLCTSGFLVVYKSVQKRTETYLETETETETETEKPRVSFWKQNDMMGTWRKFKAMRTSIKKPVNDVAETRLIAKLEKLGASGHDMNELMLTAIEHCWQTVYEPKGNDHGKNGTSNGSGHRAIQTPLDRHYETVERLRQNESYVDGEVVGKNDGPVR